MVLRLILGDQLNNNHSWFQEKSSTTLYVMMEMRQETDYVRHHIQKLIGFFSAMRLFAQNLENQGHKLTYLRIDDERNTQSLTQNLEWLIEQNKVTQFEYQLPDEYRLDVQLKAFSASLNITTKIFDTEHFLSQRKEIGDFFKGKKTFLMESFYRRMRKKYDILMDGNEPLTGQWNYDADNRKKLPKDHRPIEPLVFCRDVTEIYELVQKQEIKTIGSLNPKNFFGLLLGMNLYNYWSFL